MGSFHCSQPSSASSSSSSTTSSSTVSTDFSSDGEESSDPEEETDDDVCSNSDDESEGCNENEEGISFETKTLRITKRKERSERRTELIEPRKIESGEERKMRVARRTS